MKPNICQGKRSPVEKRGNGAGSKKKEARGKMCIRQGKVAADLLLVRFAQHKKVVARESMAGRICL